VVLDQARQPTVEAVVETFDFVGGMVLHFTQIDQRFNDRAVSPNIGAAQVVHAQDLNVFEGHKLAGKVGDGSGAEQQGRRRGLQGCNDTIVGIHAGVQQGPGSCFIFDRDPIDGHRIAAETFQ
jgi:hypothetical protein